MTQQDARRLDGVLPTALEGLQQRRETIKNLREIDKLLRDDLDESLATTSRPSSTRGCSFGSARNPARNPRYWLAKSSSAPGPGAYVASKADGLIKPKVGGGGALGLRSGVCCRFQPCECKKSKFEAVEALASESDAKYQDTKQPRRASPQFVAYARPSSTEPDFQTREQQRRVAAVQAAKQRWTHLGLNTAPNHRWTERRVGAGGVLPMGKSTSRDGAGNSAAKARLRQLFVADRKAQKCATGALRAVKATAVASINSKGTSGPAVNMMKLPGRDSVRCQRKNQRVVTAFGK
ncbi:hypothetical protein PRIC1_004778 [Phytophthora ramorum]